MFNSVSEQCTYFGSIVYNLAMVDISQNFLQVVVHVIITDQCNQSAH